ncbi:trypsin-like peptidase domain-containing protein [Sorangium sp. So ce291]|uniref:trypsin-like peptidase domain-containing protein n=1 Tax=Sorangium sp. So ce291 TaxID=3133294 RepID=UPI003F6318ED
MAPSCTARALAGADVPPSGAACDLWPAQQHFDAPRRPIRALFIRVSLELMLRKQNKNQHDGERAHFVLEELESAIELLLDNGVEEPADAQLAAIAPLPAATDLDVSEARLLAKRRMNQYSPLACTFVIAFSVGCMDMDPDTHLGTAEASLEGDPRREARDADGDIERLTLQATALNMPMSSLSPTDGGYTLNSAPFTTFPDGTAACPRTPFYGQPRVAGSTGFLVGKDLFLTASHTYRGGVGTLEEAQAACPHRGFAFGFDLPPDGPDGRFKPALTIHAADVYRCVEVVAFDALADFVLVRVDREVNRVPLKLHRQLPPSWRSSIPMVIAGHIQKLATKIEATTGGSSEFFPIGPRVIKIVTTQGHVGDGSSGSPVSDGRSGRVEGLVTSGYTSTGYDPVRACRYEQPSTDGIAFGPASVEVASFVPVVGLEVSPESELVSYGPPGGPFSDPTASYTYSAGAAGVAVPLTVSVEGPLVLTGKRLPSVVPPGTVRTLDTALAANHLGVGIHEASVSFLDNAYRTVDRRVHRIAVGLDGLVPTPVGGSDEMHMTYDLRNRWLVPQAVAVSTDAPWLALTTPSQTIPAGGIGTVGLSLASTSAEPPDCAVADVTFETELRAGVVRVATRRIRYFVIQSGGHALWEAGDLPCLLPY